LTTNVIGICSTFSLISNIVKTFFFTSLALRWISTTFFISVVIKLLFNPLLISNYNLSRKCWIFCNELSPWCDMLSLELQGFSIGLQCKAIYPYLVVSWLLVGKCHILILVGKFLMDLLSSWSNGIQSCPLL
jgi:hypothetical protein